MEDVNVFYEIEAREVGGNSRKVYLVSFVDIVRSLAFIDASSYVGAGEEGMRSLSHDVSLVLSCHIDITRLSARFQGVGVMDQYNFTQQSVMLALIDVFRAWSKGEMKHMGFFVRGMNDLLHIFKTWQAHEDKKALENIAGIAGESDEYTPPAM